MEAVEDITPPNYNSSEYIEGGDSQDLSYQQVLQGGKLKKKPGHKGGSKSISHTPNPHAFEGNALLQNAH
jgi:hypothetical protein